MHQSAEGDPSFLSFPTRTRLSPRAALLCSPDLCLRDSCCCPSPWRTAPEVQETKTKDIDCFISPCQDKTCFSWFSVENPKAMVIITTQLGWKKKKTKSAKICRDAPAPANPCCAPSWQSSVPGTEPQPEQAAPSLWATILLVSVTPFVFFYSCFHLLLNIPLIWHLLLSSAAKTHCLLPGWDVSASLLDLRSCSCISAILCLVSFSFSSPVRVF